jgi:S-adenosylmethionine:tRNA ribosyltransferase-isomerase
VTRAYHAARDEARLLVLEGRSGRVHDRLVVDLPDLLVPGDLLVVNDAATLPASLGGRTGGGAPIELRLAGRPQGDLWPAVLLGAGDWRTATEHRAPPPPVAAGDRLVLGEDLVAQVASLSPISPRLMEVAFDRAGEALWRAIYQHGRPVQYAHAGEDLALWTVQTAYADRPWAVEMPSAGRPLSWRVLAALRRRGVAIAPLTHAAGLSATGDPAIDAALPLPEAYDIPAATARAIAAARARASRVIAVGTTVVRALEGAARTDPRGRIRPGAGVTDLVLGEESAPLVVDGLLSGIHVPGESHHRLLGTFAPAAALAAADRRAAGAAYRRHELGDLCLILPSLAPPELLWSELRGLSASPGVFVGSEREGREVRTMACDEAS